MYEEKYMLLAIEEAKKAYKMDEIPIGAVIVHDNEVIASAFNMKEKRSSSIFHAEILAILEANEKIKNWRLDDCDIYITMEPCPMCASAIHQSRIRNVFFGTYSQNKENYKVIEKIFKDNFTNQITNIEGGYLEEKCLNLLKLFFKKRREK